MSEKINVNSAELCIANINKNGEVVSGPTTDTDGGNNILGVYVSLDGEGLFLPLIAKTDPQGEPYIGFGGREPVKANLLAGGRCTSIKVSKE